MNPFCVAAGAFAAALTGIVLWPAWGLTALAFAPISGSASLLGTSVLLALMQRARELRELEDRILGEAEWHRVPGTAKPVPINQLRRLSQTWAEKNEPLTDAEREWCLQQLSLDWGEDLSGPMNDSVLAILVLAVMEERGDIAPRRMH